MTETSPASPEDRAVQDHTVREHGVTGLTCGHCVTAVVEEVEAIDGVREARVDLAVGGTSRLTVAAERPIDREALVAAIAEAGDGYALTDA